MATPESKLTPLLFKLSRDDDDKYTMAVHEVGQSNLPQALCASPPMSCTPTDATPPLDVVGQCLKSGLCFPEASLNEVELVGDTVTDSDRTVVDAAVKRVLSGLREGGTEIDTYRSAGDVVKLLNGLVQHSERGETAFFLYDVGTVVRKYEQWMRLLPRVKPHYAVKCNPDPVILKTLQICGAGFDCASDGELDAVLAIGGTSQDIIYANPCKQIGGIRRASSLGVRRMTFDNNTELQKIAEHYPEAELVVRIKPPTEMALMSFSRKFGASTAKAIRLVKKARKLSMKVVGVSFHVGSGCYSISAYIDTLNEARKVFDAAESLGAPMSLLDIGGGWPGVDGTTEIGGHQISFPSIAEEIGPVVDELFPEPIQIISEPGRYFVAECAILCVNIIGKKRGEAGSESESESEADEDLPAGELELEEVEKPSSSGNADADGMVYYISDGVYGSFNAIHYDHLVPLPQVLSINGEQATPKSDSDREGDSPTTHKSTLFGPTCDSMDIVCAGVELPDLSVGDWLYFYNMGAYTKAAASSFNGFPLPSCHYYISIDS